MFDENNTSSSTKICLIYILKPTCSIDVCTLWPECDTIASGRSDGMGLNILSAYSTYSGARTIFLAPDLLAACRRNDVTVQMLLDPGHAAIDLLSCRRQSRGLATAQLLEFCTEQRGLPLQHRQLQVSRRAVDQGGNGSARPLPSLLRRVTLTGRGGATAPDHRPSQRGIVRCISRGPRDRDEARLGHGAPILVPL